MVNIGYLDILQIAQTIGIVETLLITLYFSNRQIRGLSIDIETKVLSDLDEKEHRLYSDLQEHPELARVINTVQSLSSEENGSPSVRKARSGVNTLCDGCARLQANSCKL
jgi:hypothetical protein